MNNRLEFRLLRADEIDVRVSQVTEKNVMLLLYKDARCDMNILDETVGPMNWKREHLRDNANCIVSIWDDDKKQWIGKEDTGTESNTEAEKGLASDSFKRACFNWGLGRELYTAPSLFFPLEKTKAKKNTQGRWQCYDRFVVTEINYDGRQITSVKIRDINTGEEISAANRAPAAVKPANKSTGTRRSGAATPQNGSESSENGPVLDSAAKVDKISELINDSQKKAFLDKIRAVFVNTNDCNAVYQQIMDELGIGTMGQMTYGMWTEAVVKVDQIAAQKKSA